MFPRCAATAPRIGNSALAGSLHFGANCTLPSWQPGQLQLSRSAGGHYPG